MNKKSEPKDSLNVSPDESETVVLIKKLQQHLVVLEKKIDSLVEGASRKPFDKKSFSRPGRSGGSSHRRTEGGYRSSERSFGRTGSFGPSRGGQYRNGPSQSRDEQPRGGQYRGGESRGGQYRSGPPQSRDGQSRGGQYRGGPSQSRGGPSRGGQYRGGQSHDGPSRGQGNRKKPPFRHKKD